MSAVRRDKIPVSMENQVLFRTNHTCCICRKKGKDVQIHHIDCNKSNNKPANLAVLCLDCHSKVSGTRGLGRAYKPGEIRMYKRSWEQSIQQTRKVHRPQARYRKQLISQIDLIICEILACRKNRSRIEELLNILSELHIWRGSPEIDKKIIEGLHHLAIMSGLDSPRLASLVPEKLWEMSCLHLVGPDYVQIDKRDLTQVLNCIDALSTLADFNCEFGHSRKPMESITDHTEDFFEIGLWYNKKRIANAVIRLYTSAIKSCYSNGKLEFKYGQIALLRSIKRLKKLLSDEQPHWVYQRYKLEAFLKFHKR